MQPFPAGSLPATGNDHHVLIIGYGPSGALAAHMLGRSGINVLVIDRQEDVYDKPRAIAMDHEIARTLDNQGLLDLVRPVIAPFSDSQHFGAAGQLIRSISMVDEPWPMGYTPTMVFSQPPFEAALRQAVAGLHTVSVALGTTLTGLSQTDRGVVAQIRDPDGSTRSVSADWLIGCDGASSLVRDLVGITLEDLDFDEPWIVVDMRVHPGKGANLPASSANFCDPARPIVYIEGPAGHRRWEIMLNADEDPQLMQQPERVWQMLAPWVTPQDADLWRAAAYRFHALVARTWRAGRVLLAGDAAHQQPPILGQGMCQGMRDVANLTWKLERVLRGQSPETLLDSYGAERRPHARELILRIKEMGKVLCERDPQAARLRDADLLAQGNGAARRITRQSVIPELGAGLIVPSRGAGSLFPQPWLLTGAGRVLMDRAQGHGWRLIARADADLPPSLQDACHSASIRLLQLATHSDVTPAAAIQPVVEADGVLACWFAAQDCSHVLVRPDHYVFGTANDAEGAAALVLAMRDALAGRIPPKAPLQIAEGESV